MKLNIFLKIAGALISVSVTPILIVSFLINLSYLELVNKYLPPQEIIREELFLSQQNIQIQVGLILLLIVVLTIFVAILIGRSFSRLEVKVKTRTEELEELTQSLDNQVKERTKELQEKVEQLERFQKLVVGRELKMIELKKEIKKLKD